MNKGKDITPLDIALVRDGLSLSVHRAEEKKSIECELYSGDYFFTSGGIKVQNKQVAYSYSGRTALNAINGVSREFANAVGLSERHVYLQGEDALTSWFLRNGQADFHTVSVVYVPAEVHCLQVDKYAKALQIVNAVQAIKGCKKPIAKSCDDCLRKIILEFPRNQKQALDAVRFAMDFDATEKPDNCQIVALQEYLETSSALPEAIVREPGLLHSDKYVSVDAINRGYLMTGEKSAGIIGTVIRLNRAIQDYKTLI